MSNQTLSNGFSDLVVPVCEGGTNDSTTLSLSFDGVDQGAKGTIETLEAAGALTAWARVNDASRADTFRLQPTASGYKALPAALTIDGVTVQPAIRLEGEDADLSAWTDTLNSNAFAIAGTGADPTFDENTPGIDCKRVKFNAGKSYQAGNGSVGSPGTNDFVLEMVFQYDSTSPSYVLTKIDPTIGAADSIAIYFSSGNLVLSMDSAGGPAVTQALAASFVNGVYYHVIVFFDRSGNARSYVNGAAGTAANVSAFAADNIAVNGKWTVGGYGTNLGSNPMISAVSYFALWHRASWLTFADYAGIAAKRFAQCCGVYAGTAQQLNPGFVDLDFETAGTASWTAAAGAILSKEAGARTGGSGSQVLRVLGDGSTANGKASQTKVGGITRFTGWARGDGTAVPAIYISGSLGGSWTGTASTTWQYFDVTVKDLTYAGNRVDLFVLGVTSGYVEFDDVTIEVDGAIPTAQARTTVAHLEKWNTAGTESYLIPVGAGWARTDKIKCADASFKTGVRVENQQTNRLLYSEDFSQANWTKTRVTLGTPATALGVLAFTPIIASADNATHLVAQGVTTAASESHAVSIYAKAGAVNSIMVELNEDATQFAYYNLSTGLVGDKGAGFTLTEPAQIYDQGGGYYRCEFRPTTPGITGTVNVYLSNGSTVGSETFAGDASTPSIYLSGAQFERYPGGGYQAGSLLSYVKTTTATVTRTGDTLTYHGYENCGGKSTKNITAKVDYVCPVFTAAYYGYRNILSLSAKASTNRADLFRDVSTGKLLALVSVGGVSQALLNSAAAVEFTGNNQTVEMCFAKDNINIVLGRVVNATDTAADLPELQEIVIGASYGYVYHLGGIITDFRLSPYGTVYPRAILALEKGSHTQSAFIAYDALDDSTYELRAGAGTTRGVTLKGGVLSPAAWHLISLEWSGGTSVKLRIDGAQVGSAVANATIAGLTDLLVAWAGLKGYAYAPSAGALSYPITFGAVSIADVQLHSAAPPAAWYTEMIARGVPAKNEHLIHQISQTSHLDATHYDLLTGTAGTKTTEGAVNAFVPPTEVGLSLGANAGNNTIVDFGSSFAFMAATSHSYDAWIRVDGSGDQCVWANGNANGTNFQALLYDDATDSLVYRCIVGATVRSVSAEIELDRLYHVAITRDYDSGAGTTTLTIYIDSAPIESQVYTGAPVVTNDAFVMLSTSEAAGVFTLPFIGATVGNRFYDDALTLAEIEAIYDADSLVMVNGPYATQAVTAATLPATISGAVKTDGAGGYPIVLVQAESGGEWRSIGSAESSAAWSTFEKATPVNAIRLYTKNFNTYAQSASLFDDLDGGTDPGDSTIGLVEVAKNKRKALENIVLMRKPLHSWAVMVVRYV